MNLKIQCPKCSKRFTVHEDLTGKTVECGACDHRFPVKAESIIVERSKVYPGQHQDDDFLSRLGKDSSAIGGKANAAASPAAPTPQVDAIMPASAGQNIAASAGVTFVILYALVFFLGSRDGGIFQDVVMLKRIVLGSFVGLIGCGLLMFGAKNWRGRAVVVAMVLLGSLLAMVVMRPVHLTPEVGEIVERPEVPEEDETEVVLDEREIRGRVGYQAVERNIEKMAETYGSSASEYVVAIFVEEMSGTQFHSVEKYLQKALSIPPSEGLSRYPRNNERDSLIVISGLKLDFDSVVGKCDPRLGRAITYPELRLIDLRISATHFSIPSDDLRKKLANPEHPAFFSANLTELGALDPNRVGEAVGRLADVPTGIELRYEDEIVREFVRLVASETDPVLLSNIGRALRIWAGNNQASMDIVTRNVEKWMKEEIPVPASIVDYIAENPTEKGAFLVDLLWAQEPEQWVSQYAKLGVNAEPRLLFHLGNSPVRLRQQAAIILAKVGTAAALPELEKLANVPDEELKILVERAAEAIRGRQ